MVTYEWPPRLFIEQRKWPTDSEWKIGYEKVNDLKTKLQSFRTAFSRELTKVTRSMKSGSGADDTYKPTYRHWKELQFLTRVIKKRESKSNLEEEQMALSQLPTPGFIDPIDDDSNSLVWLTQTSQRFGDSQMFITSPPSPSSCPLLAVEAIQQEGASMPEEQSSVASTAQWSASQVGPEPSVTGPATSQARPVTGQTTSVAATSSRTTTSLPVQPSTSGNIKRKRKDCCEERAWDSINRYFTSKSRNTSQQNITDAEDSYNIWAKNLVEDLKKVKGRNKRTLLQIKINRIVQDEILKQIEEESVDTF